MRMQGVRYEGGEFVMRGEGRWKVFVMGGMR